MLIAIKYHEKLKLYNCLFCQNILKNFIILKINKQTRNYTSHINYIPIGYVTCRYMTKVTRNELIIKNL